eukprot:m51a1_g1109 hypothetical protein (1086) ;mRNA; f:136426-140403
MTPGRTQSTLLLLLAVAALAEAGRPRLIVRLLDPQPTLARSLRPAAARAIQDRFLHGCKRQGFELAESVGELGERVEARYSAVINAVSVVAPSDDDAGADELAARIRSHPDVLAVWPERSYAPDLYASLPQIGAPAAWSSAALAGRGRPGEGVKIAVPDWGTHKDVAMMSGAGFSWPADIPAPGLGDTTNTNAKLVVSRAFFNPMSPPSPLDNRTFPGAPAKSHGVHTSSTAAGVPVTITVDGKPMNLSGVAPYAWVMNYKVFYAHSDGSMDARDTEMLLALEAAVNDGADIISNSWGNSAFEDDQTPIALFSTIATKEKGVMFVFSAGNSGPEKSSMDHPQESALRVAAVTSVKQTVATIGTTPSWRALFPDVAQSAPQIFSKALVIGSTEDAGRELALVSVAAGDDPFGCSPLTHANYSGKAVLVTRGTCTYSDKIDNVANAGASMVVFVSTDDSPAFFSASSIPITAVGIAKSFGSLLANATGRPGGVTARLEYLTVPSALGTDVITSFSSRGPSTTMGIGPDIAAPGDFILAAGNGFASGMAKHFGYGTSSGTSMACPHVAGAAALIRQAHPKFTPAEIKSAIMTTSSMEVFVDAGHAVRATPLDTGAGRIDVARALDPALFLDPPVASFSLVDLGAASTVAVSVTAYKSLAGLSLSLVPLVANDTLPEFGLSAFPTSLAAGQRATMRVTFTGAALGDRMCNVVVRSGGEVVAHAPVWARVMVPRRTADVLLVDADGSNCSTNPDVGALYREAFEAAGFTTQTIEFPCSSDVFKYPTELKYGKYKIVVFLTGSVGTNFLPDLSWDKDTWQFVAIANQGTALMSFGARIKEIWGAGDTPMNRLCKASIGAEKAVATVATHPSAPVAFSGINATMPQGSTARNLSYSAAAGEIPILTSPPENLVFAKGYVHNEIPGQPSFRSACAVSTIGLEFLSRPARLSLIRQMARMMFEHGPRNYSLSVASDPATRLCNVSARFADGFVPVRIDVMWGDSGDAIESFKWGEPVTHTFGTAGEFSLVVVVVTVWRSGGVLFIFFQVGAPAEAFRVQQFQGVNVAVWLQLDFGGDALQQLREPATDVECQRV